MYNTITIYKLFTRKKKYMDDLPDLSLKVDQWNKTAVSKDFPGTDPH